MKPLNYSWILAGTIFLGACQDLDLVQAEPGSPSLALAAAQAASRHATRSLDDHYTEFTTEVPGFGGLFIEGATETNRGTLNVVLSKPVADAAVRPRVAALLRRLGRSDWGTIAESELRVVRGDYDFAELSAWYGKLVRGLPSRVVISTDIDERWNRIVVGIESSQSESLVQRAVRDSGIPAAAVVVKIARRHRNEVRLSGYVRPTVGGIRIRSTAGAGCTQGFNAVRVESDGSYDPGRYFITNYHCTDGSGVVTGIQMYQPRAPDLIGYEVADPPLFTSAEDYRCPPDRMCRFSDAALFRYYDFAGSDFPRIAHVGSGSDSLATILGYHTVNGQTNVIYGDPVHKIGSRTGWSTGNVSATCTDIAKYDGYGYDTGETSLCQSRASYSSASGDSGAPIYIKNANSTRDAVGLHWGGGGVFSNIGWVAKELNPDGNILFAQHFGWSG